jgi:crotonobetaine/carnitine-CoA ligase
MRNLPVEERVLGPILRMRAEREGDRPYLTVRGRTYSFAETEAVTRSIARGLRARGIAAGDRVALMLPNCAEFVFTWYACCLRGAALVPINTDYRGHLLDVVLSDSGAKALIIDETLVTLALSSIAAPIRAQLGLVVVVGSNLDSGDTSRSKI